MNVLMQLHRLLQRGECSVRVAMAHQMAAIDRQAIDQGIPEAALLESAGRSVATEAIRLASSGRRVVIVCGPGNNGGDGLVAARYLHNAGFEVKVFLTHPPTRLRPLCRQYAAILQDEGVFVSTELSDGNAESFAQALLRCDLVIDAILGTGAKGELRGAPTLAVQSMQDLRAPILAVDMPTGIDADTGQVGRLFVKAHATVALGAPKLGQFLLPGRLYCGKRIDVDIGIPRSLIESGTDMIWVDRRVAAAWFPPRPIDGHKGTFGRVLVIAGSKTMPGAAVLSVRGAIGAGAGLVRWAGPAAAHPFVAGHVVECTFAPQSDLDGALAADAAETLVREAAGVDAVVLGPGLSLAAGVRVCVERILYMIDAPVVLDADGLNHLANLARESGALHRSYPAARILTPHPGEMARLLGCTVEEVRENQVEITRQAARRYGAIVLLKGVPSIVADPSGQAAIITAGSPVLATGGTGDVLAGMIGGLLAQGATPWQAVGLAAYWHGKAAERMADLGEDAGHAAGKLSTYLPSARADILSGREAGDQAGD